MVQAADDASARPIRRTGPLTSDVAGGGSGCGFLTRRRSHGRTEPRNRVGTVYRELWSSPFRCGTWHVEMDSNRTALLRERVRSAHRAPPGNARRHAPPGGVAARGRRRPRALVCHMMHGGRAL